MAAGGNEVVDVPDQQHYAIRTDGAQVGLAAYTRNGSTMTFTHTEIDQAHQGGGVGGELVQGALDDVRKRGLAVVPQCSFVRHWIDDHPDYADLVEGAS